MSEDRVGERRTCGGCQRVFRVPKRSDGNSRVRSLADWVIEFLLYGIGCGLLGFFLGLLIAIRSPLRSRLVGGMIIAGCTVGGLLIGVFFGDKALTYLKDHIRDKENS